MSPEQARGEETGAASDIFSLGLVLFEMLSGQRPFAGTSDVATLHNLHFSPPRNLRDLSPEVPDGLVRTVTRMLEKDPAARGTMAEVRQRLAGICRAGEARRRSRRRRPSAPPFLAASPDRRGDPRRRRRRRRGCADTVPHQFGAWGVLRATCPPRPRSTQTRRRATYVKARALLDRFDREANPAQAITLLERAVEKDSAFAVGYATLTEAYHFRNQVAPDPQWLNLMSQSAQRAVTLNPDMAAAHIAMGIALSDQKGKTADAEASFRKAIDLDPRSAAPYRWMAVAPGTPKEQAASHLEPGLALEPRNWVLLQELGLQFYRNANTRAAAVSEKARDASPDNVRVLANLAAAYQHARSPRRRGIHASAGGHACAESISVLGQPRRRLPLVQQGAMLFRIGVADEVCGRRDQALAALQKALVAGYSEKEVRSDPELLGLRNDIRYHQMLSARSTRD